MDNIIPSQSSADSTTTNTSSSSATATSNNHNNRDQYLRHLNKLSHKISKPTNPNPTPTLPPSNLAGSSSFKKPPVEPPLPPPVHPPHHQQQQPPVYNINKSDFRDVVQKLTGSPAHAPSSTPPPIHAPKPASSRLQRIRPPPLAQLSTRPPPLLNCGVNVNPLSPLPPLPTCHAAAESPISAYMRFLHSSVSGDTSSFNRIGQMLPPPSPPPMNASTDVTTAFPPFGFLPPPKSPCPMIPPNMMFSPTGSGPLGFPQFPISPTVPGVPSPK